MRFELALELALGPATVTRGGQRERFRRDASVQMQAPALAEAKRLMARAAETGAVEEDESVRSTTLTFAAFARGPFEVMFMPGLPAGHAGPVPGPPPAVARRLFRREAPR